MGFLAGGVSAIQFHAEWPAELDGREVELLSRFAAEPRVFNADGESCGWLAGRHRRDTRFGERNLLGDFLVFDFRRSQDVLPGARVKDYAAEILAAENGDRAPTAKQRRAAKEEARDRVEDEARDGRYQRHPIVPVVWDKARNRLWFGSGSPAWIDRFVPLIGQTFGVDITPVNPATIAGREAAGLLGTQFVPGVTPAEYLWSPDVDRPVHLGNEFLLWLMWQQSGLADEVGGRVVMVSRSLTLQCPRGQWGSETVRHEVPVRLPEVRKALQSGKLPRQCGLTVVADNEQYELTIHADRWSITGGRLPQPGSDVPSDQAERSIRRLESVRAMLEAVEGLFGTFWAVRRNPATWDKEVQGIRQWLGVTNS